MLRYLSFAVLSVFVVGAMNLRADDVQKFKAPEKAEVKKNDAGQKPATKEKQGDKGKPKKAVKSDKVVKGEKSPSGEKKTHEKKIVKDGANQPVKSIEKKSHKEMPVVVLGHSTEYYTNSPAQGHPADGKLKAGTKVRIVEKAGAYVRVVAQIEAFVPVDSLKQAEAGQKKAVDKNTAKKPALDKQVPLKKKAVEKDKSPAVKDKANVTKSPEKKAPQEKAGKGK